MPKMKTRSAVKKRFCTTADGHVRRHKANKSHLQGKKNRKRKRSLRQATLVDASFEKRIRGMLRA